MPEKADPKTKLVFKKKVDIGNLFQTGKENAASKTTKQGDYKFSFWRSWAHKEAHTLAL